MYMNTWEKVIFFFNENQKSTRREFYTFMKKNISSGYTTLDTYRNNLRSAGFLETVDRGMYKRIKKIPNISVKECLKKIEKINRKQKEIEKQEKLKNNKYRFIRG